MSHFASSSPSALTKHRHARDIWLSAVQAVEPYQLVTSAVKLQDNKLSIRHIPAPSKHTNSTLTSDVTNPSTSNTLTLDPTNYDSILLIGSGKASIGMTLGIEQVLQHTTLPITGHIVTKHGHTEQQLQQLYSQHPPLKHVTVSEASHPVPDEHSIAGAARLIAHLQHATPRTLILYLLSGGSSSLIEKPLAGITLDDLRAFNTYMHSRECPIDELNILRSVLSEIKAGQLLQYAKQSTWLTLILSDVIGNDLRAIGSGPTVVPHAHASASPTASLESVVRKYKLLDASRIPASVKAAFTHAIAQNSIQSPPSSVNVHNLLVGTNLTALRAAEAAALRFGYANTLLLTDQLSGDSKAAASFLLSVARSIQTSSVPVAAPACLLVGGETTVDSSKASASSKGGRCQAMALHASLLLRDACGITLLAAGSDGQDHVNEAAGAIADCFVSQLADQHGVDMASYHSNYDSFGFYQKLDTAANVHYHIASQMTGTNVADIIVVLIDAVS